MDDLAPEGISLRFRPQGVARFAGATFLAVWLTGWAVGELVALATLTRGLSAFLAGTAPATPGMPLLAGGAFLMLWLVVWTLGGVAAIRQLLRTLWADDRLVLRGDRLICTRRIGPFSTTRRFEAREIRSIHVREPGSGTAALVAQLASNSVVLTDCGDRLQWIEAAERLRQALHLPDPSIPDPAGAAVGGLAVELPQGWQCLDDPLGDRLLVPDLRIRRRQTWVMGAITAPIGAGALTLSRASLADPGLWVLALIVSILAALCLWGTLWLGLGRIEWRISARRLVQQRRFGGRLRERWEARALELLETSDSDNDHWYDLRAIELSSEAPGRLPGAISLSKVLHDPTVPRQLGLWLARETRMPFHDRVPNEARRQAERREEISRDLALLREHLPSSGRSGRFRRWLLAWLERQLGPRPPASDRSVREGRNADGSPPRSPGGA